MTAQTVLITLDTPELIDVKRKVRSYSDERVRVDRYIVEYVGSDGDTYRKAFEVKPGLKPRIPPRGENTSITNMCKQW